MARVVRWVSLVVAVSGALWGRGLWASPPTSKGGLDDQLKAAYHRGDRNDVHRRASLLDAAALTPSLLGSSRTDTLIALAAAPSVRGGIWLLEPLEQLSARPDRSISARAAQVALQLSQSLQRTDRIWRDLPDDWIRSRIDRYAAVASTTWQWPDVRVLALETSAELFSLLEPGDIIGRPFDLVALIGDVEPAVRRAALELDSRSLTDPSIQAIAELVKQDKHTAVALAAAQRLCGPTSGLPVDRARQALATATAMDRLFSLVADPAGPLAARIDASRCADKRDGKAASSALGRLRRDAKAVDRRLERLVGEP